jgi:hypothetical protein
VSVSHLKLAAGGQAKLKKTDSQRELFPHGAKIKIYHPRDFRRKIVRRGTDISTRLIEYHNRFHHGDLPWTRVAEDFLLTLDTSPTNRRPRPSLSSCGQAT